MFFFYSSYGILESLKKKGNHYAKSLLTKGIILLIKSEIMILLFLFVNIFVFKNKITLMKYLLCAIFKSAMGNSNWFAFTIIMFYFYSYLSFGLIQNNIILGIIIINLISLIHIIFVYKYYFPKAIYFLDNVLCYNIGYYYSFWKNYIDKLIMKNDIYYFFITSVIIYLYHIVFNSYSLMNRSFRNTLFSLIIVLTSTKIKLNNDFLQFLNSHSYSIYLLQKLILWVTYEKKIFKNDNFIQISFEFISIFFISSIFDKYNLFKIFLIICRSYIISSTRCFINIFVR